MPRSSSCGEEFIVERNLNQLGPVCILVLVMDAKILIGKNGPRVPVNHGGSFVDPEGIWLM